MLVTLSGLDGAGKSTLAEALKARLEKDGTPAVIFHMNKQVGLYAYVRNASRRSPHGNERSQLPNLSKLAREARPREGHAAGDSPANHVEQGVAALGRPWRSRDIPSSIACTSKRSAGRC